MEQKFKTRPNNRIKELLKKKKITQAKAAAHVGVPLSTLGSWCQNSANPKPEKAMKLAEMLSVSVAYMLGWVENDSEGFAVMQSIEEQDDFEHEKDMSILYQEFKKRYKQALKEDDKIGALAFQSAILHLEGMGF